MSRHAEFRVGIDVGGTFTDFVLLEEGAARPTHSFKVPSTTDDPAEAVLQGLRHITGALGVPPDSIAAIVHGTTIGLNAVVQRTGAHVGLVVTRGFRDVLQLTQRLPEEFNLRQPHLRPLVAREDIAEFSARLDPHGAVLCEPDDAEMDAVAAWLRERGVESIAVSVLHGYADPRFEARQAQRVAERMDGVPVSSGAAIWPQIREYERTSLATLNASVAPLMRRYLTVLGEGISDLGIAAPLLLTTSSGGCIGFDAAIEHPVQTLLSGPAAGVAAAATLAADADGNSRLISIDMGGTSTDMSVIADGEASTAVRSEIGGIPLIMPVVDVNAIGAGGGSIVAVDHDGHLHVGPRSAGAVPGPIAFGRGGVDLTLTDVFLLAGYISPATFERRFGTLDLDAARLAAERLADRLALDGRNQLDRFVSSVLSVSSAVAASELQKVLARSGYTATEFSLVAFGGAGPVQGALLAEEIGAREVIVPREAGTFCALGAARATVRRTFLRGIAERLDTASVELANRTLERLIDDARAWARRQLPAAYQRRAADPTVRLALHARYRGQAYTLVVPLGDRPPALTPDELSEAVHQAHEREFGYRDLGSPIEIGDVQVEVSLPTMAQELPGTQGEQALVPASDFEHTRHEHRAVLFGSQRMDAAVSTESDGAAAVGRQGPLVFDLPDTTVLVPPGWQLEEATETRLVIRRKEHRG